MRLFVAAGVFTMLVGCGTPDELRAGAAERVTTSSTLSATTTGPRAGAGVQTAELTAAAAALRDEAQRRFPAVFGGVYWQGDRVKLAFTHDAEILCGQLVANFPRPDLVDAVTVDFPLAHLQAVTERISADSADLGREGVTLSTWGVNPTTNRVEVGIEQPTPAVIENLRHRYGWDLLDIIDRPRPRAVNAGTPPPSPSCCL